MLRIMRSILVTTFYATEKFIQFSAVSATNHSWMGLPKFVSEHFFQIREF